MTGDPTLEKVRSAEQQAAAALGLSPLAGDPDRLDVTLVLPEFEGPLDLLLHLVRKHELDVFNIPISFITSQYLKALDELQRRSAGMDLASEYLLMAATLAYIKSRELLPPEAKPVEEGEDPDLEELGDPREHLVRRLLEYQKFKAAAAELLNRPVVGRNVFTRNVSPEESASELLGPAPLLEIPVWELIELLAQVHGRTRRKLTHEVTIERLSLADRINQINETLDRVRERTLTFDTMLTSLAELDTSSSFYYQIVLSFMAILEMARLRLVAVYQADELGAIYLTRATPVATQLELLSGDPS